MFFSEINNDNFDEWLSMGCALWPHAKKKDLEVEFRSDMKLETHKHVLAENNNGEYLGFISLSLRNDYVQGSSSSPVGYIEGIYVKPMYRGKGVAKELVKQGEKWAIKFGCKELGSDTELSNTESQEFHNNLGFKKDDVIVHYIKEI